MKRSLSIIFILVSCHIISSYECHAQSNKKDLGRDYERAEHWVHVQEYEKAKQEFVSSNINKISTNFCCFGQRSDTLTAYSKLLGLVFGKLTPLRLRVDCYLFHGCDPLTTTKSATTSREVYFNSTVTFNQNISFEKLKYCQLPEKSRLSFNIVLIFKE